MIFSGANDYSCDVFGYSYVGDTDPSDATLIFNSYMGEFSGDIGGFADITISGDTEMVIDSAASISNTSWVFDFTERNSDVTMLTWDDGEFAENSSVAVSFADDSQAAEEWSIAAMSDASNATFDLTIGESTWDNLAYGVGIDDGSDWDGWGFTLDSGVLKFKNLA